MCLPRWAGTEVATSRVGKPTGTRRGIGGFGTRALQRLAGEKNALVGGVHEPVRAGREGGDIGERGV